MKTWKVVAVAALTLVTAGCAQTGIESMPEASRATFGLINPAIPQGWVKQVRGNGVIAFKCPDNNCAELGEVAYSEMRASDEEGRIRRLMVSSRSFGRESGDALSSMSGGAMKQIAFKDQSDQSVVRFERVMITNRDNGREYYIVYRTVSNDRSRIVSATAPTLDKARRYMKIGLAAFPQ